MSVLLAVAIADAQGPQEWMKRILDPAKVGLAPPAGAVMNRKLTVDYLSKEDPPKELAIYMMPLDQMAAASDHFSKALGVAPEVTGSGMFEIRRFSAPAKGVSVMLSRSQFVDNKLQVTIEYVPPPAK